MVETIRRVQTWVRDLIASILPAKVLHARAEAMVERFDTFLEAGETVLDVGCGYGHAALILQERRGCRVSGVDVHLGGPRVAGVPMARCDGLSLPFPDQSFDGSLVLTVLHHSTDPEALLAEAIRVARRRIVIIEDRCGPGRERFWSALKDAVINVELAGHPHQTRTPEAWESLFAREGLSLLHRDAYSHRMLGIRFDLVVWVLERG